MLNAKASHQRESIQPECNKECGADALRNAGDTQIGVQDGGQSELLQSMS